MLAYGHNFFIGLNMSIKLPIYTEEAGTHKVTIYQEMEDGLFRRTGTQLLREFHHNFTGISVSEGEIVSSRYDRVEREWQTPTVTYHYGRPQSFYAFLRTQIKSNKIYVGSSSSMQGRIIKFSLHELQFKPSASRGVRNLAIKKYQEIIELMEVDGLDGNS